MKIINTVTGETVAEIITNHRITIDEALYCAGADKLEVENAGDPDYILNGKELWYDELELEY